MTTIPYLTKKNVKYAVYQNIIKLIDNRKLSLEHTILDESQFIKQDKFIIIKANESQKKLFLFIYFLSDNKLFYKSSNLLKVFSNMSEISKAKRNYTLHCYIITTENYNKIFNNVFLKISDENKESYIQYTLVNPTSLCINILEHVSLRGYKFKVIKTNEEKEDLYKELRLNKYDDKWDVKLPKIFINDPISIWFGLSKGDILYYRGVYRLCE
jgi:DNA-directed RNA polymerase subunit H (RpoH/RPB5)